MGESAREVTEGAGDVDLTAVCSQVYLRQAIEKEISKSRTKTAVTHKSHDIRMIKTT